MHQQQKTNISNVDSQDAGGEAPRRKYHPIGQRCDKLTRRIAKRRAQQLHVEPQEQHVNEEPEYIQEQQIGDLNEHHSFPSSSPSSLPTLLAALMGTMLAS